MRSLLPLALLPLLLAPRPILAAGPGASPPNLSAYATAAQVPEPCGAVPSADTLMGSTGSAGCYVPKDASRPTSVQAANVMTDGSGAWSVTWARSFTSSAPVVNPLPVNAGTLPILCNVAARSATSASGKCWQSTSTTLPGTLAALVGLLIARSRHRPRTPP